MRRVGSLLSHSGFSRRGRSWSQCQKNPSRLQSPRPSDGNSGHRYFLGLLSASPGAVSHEHLGGVHVLQ